jgi:formylglycine-generating enzyme required for sulfatase activity
LDARKVNLAKKSLARKKHPIPKRSIRRTTIRTMKGGTRARDIHCADFIGGNQKITYGYTARDLDRLIDKVLAFLSAGATFLPSGDALRAELAGETLTFRSGAIQQLAGRRNERAYLLSLTVRRDYQIWATKFIPLAAQMDQPRALTGLEMPVAYTEFRLPPAGAGPEARLEAVPLADITDALAKHQAFVILGEPGAGKTTTLQKIAFEAARKLLGTEPGRVPLFVRLSQQHNRTPFEFLQAEWAQRTGTDLADALAAGRVLLLADGINELPRDERDERLKAWRLFATDYGEANQIVFTSREKEYESQLNLPRVRVEPLNDERIVDYLKRNDAEGLAAHLDAPRSRLREMAGNPFNLSLLVHAWKCNQREMANRGRLLEWFVGELFAREERLAHRGWIRRDAQTRALAQLAYQMQAQGESTTLALKAARAEVPATVELDGEEVALKPADLFRFARAATILDPGTDPDIRFYHHLLQEYFAALELLKRFDAGEDPSTSSGQALGALWKCKRLAEEMPPSDVGEWDALPEPPATGWEVTTILACGIARDPARLIEAVRPHNPALAGRMLDEAGIAKPDAVTNQVRADLLAELSNPAVHLRARLQAGFTLGCIGDPRFEPQTINGVKVIVPQMVRVPAGKYIIGDDTSQYADEKPQHEIELPAFEIGKWSVTNAEYACFIEAGGYKDERYWETDLAKRWLKGEDVTGGQFATWLQVWKTLQSTPNWKEQFEQTGSVSPEQIETYKWIAGLSEEELKSELSKQLSSKSREHPRWWNDSQYNNPSQPVVGVTWFEANAYCAWLAEITGCAFRLPTEVEWEAAARSAEGRVYPWGDEWDATRANTIEGRVLKPSPVGAYAAVGGVSESGAEDQSGNVWDWTSTLYREYPYQSDDRENSDSEGERVVRGGSWLDDSNFARCAARGRLVPDGFSGVVGFRLCSPGSSPAS